MSKRSGGWFLELQPQNQERVDPGLSVLVWCRAAGGGGERERAKKKKSKDPTTSLQLHYSLYLDLKHQQGEGEKETTPFRSSGIHAGFKVETYG